LYYEGTLQLSSHWLPVGTPKLRCSNIAFGHQLNNLLWVRGAESVFCCFFSVQSITCSVVFESSAKCRFICEEERESQVITSISIGQ